MLSLICHCNIEKEYLVDSGLDKLPDLDRYIESLLVDEALIKSGASIEAKDHDGFNAFDISVQEGVVSEFTFLKPS